MVHQVKTMRNHLELRNPEAVPCADGLASLARQALRRARQAPRTQASHQTDVQMYPMLSQILRRVPLFVRRAAPSLHSRHSLAVVPRRRVGIRSGLNLRSLRSPL